MTAHLHSSIWTLEVDDKPTLAFEAKKYSEANELCHEDWLRVELGLQKFNGVPLCRVDSDLRIRRAVEANNSSDDSNLVYLIELDDVGRSVEQPTNPGAFPPQRT